MRPGEILDAQRDLLERLEGNPMFAAHQAIAATTVLGLDEQARYRLARARAGDGLGAGKAWVAALTAAVKAAYAYRVTPDMCMVLNQAADSLDESDTFDRNLAPTGCGIVRFERPIEVVDARGATMLIHWAVWGPALVKNEPGLHFTFYNDTWTQPDSAFRDYEEWVKVNVPSEGEKHSRAAYDLAMGVIGRWMSAHQTAMANGETLGPPTLAVSEAQQAAIIASGGEPQPATNLVRYMHALFLLLNQTIVQTEDEFPDRHARKRAVKAGLPPKVTVVKLRRVTDRRQEGETLVEWSHRWIVRGHWAWRKCGPEHPQAQEYDKGFRVRVWISPYQKGPDDKPLIVSDKLYSLDR